MKYALIFLALAGVVATSAYAPKPGAKAPFANRHPYRVTAERVIERSKIDPNARPAEAPDPIYFSEKSGHILLPTYVNGQRSFVRSEEVLKVGHIYYNAATGERMKAEKSPEGLYRLSPMPGQYVNLSASQGPNFVGSGSEIKGGAGAFSNTDVGLSSNSSDLRVYMNDNRGYVNFADSVTEQEARAQATASCQEQGLTARSQAAVSMPNGSKNMEFVCA